MPTPDDQDPRWQRFADRAIAELVPMLDRSACCVSFVPLDLSQRRSIRYCLELGTMIVLDKPIVVVIPPGAKVPDKLVRVADAIVELDIADQRFKERLKQALGEVVSRREASSDG